MFLHVRGGKCVSMNNYQTLFYHVLIVSWALLQTPAFHLALKTPRGERFLLLCNILNGEKSNCSGPQEQDKISGDLTAQCTG